MCFGEAVAVYSWGAQSSFVRVHAEREWPLMSCKWVERVVRFRCNLDDDVLKMV